MAIDEKALGDIAPQDSAVDRLRRKNRRIRPWESSLVDAGPKNSTETIGIDSPPGQIAQGENYPVGLDLASDERAKDPEGLSTSGSPDQWSNKPPGESTIATHEALKYPLGEVTSGSANQWSDRTQVDSTTGQKTEGVKNPQDSVPPGEKDYRSRSGLDPQRIFQPLGNLPTGLFSSEGADPRGKLLSSGQLGNASPSGQDNQRVESSDEHPYPTGKFDSDGASKYPRGVSPSGSFDHSKAALDHSCLVDENGYFDPRSFLPQQHQVSGWLEKGKGEFHIPHRLFEFLNRVTTTRNELLVLSCLFRFSLGFRRPWCEAGYSFISAWTGISDQTNVKKSIRSLVAQGIVIKTREHNSAANTGTIYEIPVVQAYLNYTKAIRQNHDVTNENSSKTKSSAPVGELPTGSDTQRAKDSVARGCADQGPVGETPPKKERLKYNLKKTLFSQLPTELIAYVEQIKAPTKRESEKFFLEKLLENYDGENILRSLNYVLQNGVLGTREPCHSPLKYLATTIDQISDLVEKFERRAAMVAEINGELVSDSNSRPDCAEVVREFKESLSLDEQAKFEAQVTEANCYGGFTPPKEVIKSLAAALWKSRV